MSDYQFPIYIMDKPAGATDWPVPTKQPDVIFNADEAWRRVVHYFSKTSNKQPNGTQADLNEHDLKITITRPDGSQTMIWSAATASEFI